MTTCEISRDEDSFLYFAFGSNLLSQRIHINNPSAEKVDIGKLNNFRLEFSKESARWKGSVANIAESIGDYVYGVLWKIHVNDMANLDRQEGVASLMYRPLEIEVHTQKHGLQKARSYQLVTPDEASNLPSYVYLNVIVQGAIENGLPEDYVARLKQIDHNGYKGDVDVKLDLENLKTEF